MAPTALLVIPKARNERQLRRILRGEIRWYARRAHEHAEFIGGYADELDADDQELLEALERVAELVDHEGVSGDYPGTDATIEFVSVLAALVATGDRRACALDMEKGLPAELYERVEPSAAAVGRAAMFTYVRWAQAIPTDVLDFSRRMATLATMHAIHWAIADGIVHARDASCVPSWLQTELTAALGRGFDAREAPTELEAMAGSWFNRVALEAVRELARTWTARAHEHERATMQAATSRSVNALLARLTPQLEVLPDLPCLADCFAFGHAYGLVERLLDEIADAQDVLPLRSLDAPQWFNLLTEDA